MMKTYALQVDELREADFDGYLGNRIGIYSKGHHDPKEFVRVVREYLAEMEGDDAPEISGPERVQHQTWRTVPTGEQRTMLYLPAKPGTPGAYPVTTVYC